MSRTDVGTGSGLRRTSVRLALSALLSLGLIATATVADADARRAIESILSERGYQKELPLPPTPKERSDERVTMELPDMPNDFGMPPDRSPSSAGTVLKSLLWVLAIVGGILLMIYLIGAIRRLPRREMVPRAKKASDGGGETVTAADVPATPFDEIERLAREGAFAEAVHLLLLHCLEDLRRRSPHGRNPALTSREILAGAGLPGDVRASLAFIVSAVEVGHFGGRPVDKPVYERCVESYRTITAASAL